MARQRQRQVVTVDTGTVVTDLDQTGAALLHLDINLRRSGIQRVFQQFLDHGRRAFNDFTGGNLVGETVVQQVDARSHGVGIVRVLPSCTLSSFMRLASRMAWAETPYWTAMADRLSPGLTVCVRTAVFLSVLSVLLGF